MASQARRAFLAMAGKAALLPAAVAHLDHCSAAPVSSSSGEAFWRSVRDEFSFTEQRVPMNAANLCPAPKFVADRVTQLTKDIDGDCSFNNRAKFPELLERSREKVARQLGVTADEIALVRNTSEANNVINNGLALEPGDEVVLWDQNHPTNNVAWDVRAKRFGLRITRVTTPAAPANEQALCDPFISALTNKTRVLAVTHASNVSGVKLPIKQLCAAAHERSIHVHVDGAQTWGALDLDLRDLDCDSFSGSAHKWFMGPKEVGLLYVKASRISSIWPNVVAPGWGTDEEPDVRGARKFESLGQRDDAALSAIADTVEFHERIGAAKVEHRVYELANLLKSKIAEHGLELVTPLAEELSAGVCVVRLPEEKQCQVWSRMYEEFGIAGAPTGGLRLCPHVYNTREHVERAAEGLKALLG